MKEKFRVPNIGEIKVGRIVRVTVSGGLLFLTLSSSNPQRPDEVDIIAKNQSFSVLSFAIQHAPPKVLARVKNSAWEILGQGKPRDSAEEAATVKRYFASNPRDVSMEPQVETILENQITDVLKDEGIDSFIPVMAKITGPAKSLQVSPRNEIKLVKQIPMKHNISLEEIEQLEKRVFEEAKFSAAVAENGGLATVPPVIVRNTDLLGMIKTTAHEWFHQYLVLRPLGWEYLLHYSGIKLNNEAVNINETLADIVAGEIGRKVFESYYQEDEKQEAHEVSQKHYEDDSNPPFDFNKAMKDVRIQVENDLKEGEIEKAEQFMEEKRIELSSRGGPRKLNQAYLAFSGNYKDGPSPEYEVAEQTLEKPQRQLLSPTDMLKKLREESKSLKEFLDKAGEITSIDQLKKSIEK